MGMQAQGQQGQVFYDADSNQYYTQPSQRNDNPMAALFGLNRNSQRNYLNNFNNQSMTARPAQQFTPIDIAALFPEMYQGAQGMQGDYQAGSLLSNTGAAQSASSGAGRFM